MITRTKILVLFIIGVVVVSGLYMSLFYLAVKEGNVIQAPNVTITK